MQCPKKSLLLILRQFKKFLIPLCVQFAYNKQTMTKKHFQKLCWGVLGFALFVILWGAWVRFSHSGDGCGANWPLCNSEWIPQTDSEKTWIEWIHRVSSALFGFLVLFLVGCGFKTFPKKHEVRLWVVWSGVFCLSEALIGAGLVLFGLTGMNDSLTRLIVLNLHLLNSLCLTACLVFCRRTSLENTSVSLKRVIPLAGLFLLIASLGSISSLSNTLFPSVDFMESLAMDFDSSSPWIVQLRIFHPLLAVLIGGFFLFYLFWKFKNYFLLGCLSFALLAGMITLFSLSPIAMKLIHLFSVYLLWIALLHHLTTNPPLFFSPSQKNHL